MLKALGRAPGPNYLKSLSVPGRVMSEWSVRRIEALFQSNSGLRTKSSPSATIFEKLPQYKYTLSEWKPQWFLREEVLSKKALDSFSALCRCTN